MKNKLFAGKSTRTKIFSLITVLVIVLVIALNLGLSYFTVYDTVFLDMTMEGIYTLRPVMVNECRQFFVNEDGSLKDEEIKITFCQDPDKLISSIYTRVIYYMAIALSKVYPNFKVETVNVHYNPTAVAMYETTSLSTIGSNDVIVSYGSRYRITAAKSFWNIDSSGNIFSYDGEYKLASILMSLTLVNQPVAYFVTDHGEDYYDPEDPTSEMSASMGYMADLLTEKGFRIKTLSLSKIIEDAEAAGVVPAIPDDCVLLIINDPKEDFRSDEDRFNQFSYVSETELVDRYLTNGKGSVAVAKDYKITLPNFENFLREWGMNYSNTLVIDETNNIEVGSDREGDTLVTSYNTDENSYAYSIYGEFVDLSSAPRVILGNTGHITCSYKDLVSINETGSSRTTRIFAPFLYSSSAAVDYAKSTLTGEYVDRASEEGQKVLAAICGRQTIDSTSGNNTFSYLFCAASADYFSAEHLGNDSYANFDVTAAMIQSISRLDSYASMELGGSSLNNYAGFGGKRFVSTVISETESNVTEFYEDGTSAIVKVNFGITSAEQIVYAVFVALIPLALLVVGVVVYAKRRHS